VSIELKEGDTLFIPAFTWVHVEWIKKGIAVNHVGWANPLDGVQLYAVGLMDELWKQV
jgi:hypothetical protein